MKNLKNQTMMMDKDKLEEKLEKKTGESIQETTNHVF